MGIPELRIGIPGAGICHQSVVLNHAKCDPEPKRAVAPGEPPTKTPAVPGDSEINDEMYVYALERLVKGQKSRDVRKQIIEAGYKPSQADQILQTALRYQREREEEAELAADAYKAAGPRNMMLGGIICLVGIVVTAGTFAMASEGGGRFIFYFGVGRHRLRRYSVLSRTYAICKRLTFKGIYQPSLVLAHAYGRSRRCRPTATPYCVSESFSRAGEGRGG